MIEFNAFMSSFGFLLHREILQKRQREKEAGAAAEAERKEMEAKDQHRKHMEHSTLIHRERQMRRKRKLEAVCFVDTVPQ